jgi:putative membrane protein
MVKISAEDKARVTQAVAQAESVTCAEIVTVLAPASDSYQGYVLLYGLMLGSLISMGLWTAQVLAQFPLLLVVQFAAIVLLQFPWLKRLCIRLVPVHVRHTRAAHRAYEEYLMVSRHVAASAPIVLLYISLAERYVHILHSRSVREKVPDSTWNTVVGEFTASMASVPLAEACERIIRRIAELLAPHFPEHGEKHMERSHVIEIGK